MATYKVWEDGEEPKEMEWIGGSKDAARAYAITHMMPVDEEMVLNVQEPFTHTTSRFVVKSVPAIRYEVTEEQKDE